jgi:hypothetical protein
VKYILLHQYYIEIFDTTLCLLGGDFMTDEAARVKREYYQKYQQENRERLNKYQREWRAKNPDKVREYNQRYWEKKAQLACV